MPAGASMGRNTGQLQPAANNVDQRSWLSGLQSYAALATWLVEKLTARAKEKRQMTVAPPVTAYLDPQPLILDAPANLIVNAVADNLVSLSWAAPVGAVDHYQVERSLSITGTFSVLGNATGTSYNDTTVSADHAYLYRVRAVASGGALSLPSNSAFGTATSFEFNVLQGQQIKAQHFYDIRTAINAVRTLANRPATVWARQTLSGLYIQASDVQEMRDQLGDALTALNVSTNPYADSPLTAGVFIQAIHLEQLQTRSTRGSTNSVQIDPDTSAARVDPMNETGGGGENPLSRNFNWSLPLVNLPGRAGMDLSLTLSYNSLVWTKIGSNAVWFDADHGFPGPGFRLGFPIIQLPYLNPDTGKNTYLLIGTDGSRTELRQVGTTALYEAADSSHLLLDTSTMVLRTTDGTQLSYVDTGSEYSCAQVKDRNGNYLSVTYTALGQIDTVIDTLGRSIKFNYSSGVLTSISQTWNPGQVTHNWAQFTYEDKTIDTNFSVTVYGAPNNQPPKKMLKKVILADGSYFEFTNTSWGQVSQISNFASDTSLLNYRSYNLPPTAGSIPFDDCPRFTERRDWARYWNGDTDGVASSNEEALTSFALPASETWTNPDSSAGSGVRAQVTAPDGIYNKIYFSGTAAWRRGLPALVNTYDSGGNLRRQVMTTWTQDPASDTYVLNPRVTHTRVYDPEGNRSHTETTYQSVATGNGMTCQLPQDIYEYAGDTNTILRSTRSDYNTNAAYNDPHIIGLVSRRSLYDGSVTSGTLKSKVEFFYDDPDSIQATHAIGQNPPVQHDNLLYHTNLLLGRGNLTSVKRYDVDNVMLPTVTSTKYNTTGSIVLLRDAASHDVVISYKDKFSDGGDRDTYAYPTTVTDPDNYSSILKYNFDFGEVTSKQTPQPNLPTYTPGPEQTFTYDSIGRLQQITNVVNGAYTRFEYGIANQGYSTSQIRVDTYTTIQEGQGEAHSFTVTDGAGRLIASAGPHDGSEGGFSGQKLVYDIMGRVTKTSNQTETHAIGKPLVWDTVGDDQGVGWIYSEKTYDWKGRPLTMKNQDGSMKIISYSGCGCAGGEVVTLTDEANRQQKVYSDALGRTKKTEIMNSGNTTVYSTTVNTYNVRDQIELVTQYAGVEGSATSQVTTMSYDGHGRLKTRHLPEQNAGTSTTWTYNADDTINIVTDARGASQTFTYNGRHLTTNITYAAPAGSGIAVPAQVTVEYDGAGNRSSMTDGFGTKEYEYDSLSRLTHETRAFPVGTFEINYGYNLAGQLTSLTDPFGASFSYTRDVQGRLKILTGSPYAGFTNYINGVGYRAWGAPKSVQYSGSNSTIGYNLRLQPTQFRLTATGSGASIIREDYSYSGDGRISQLTDLDDTAGSNPPATLRYLSRSYNYDNVGRVTGSQGTGIGSMPAVPYSQSYSYNEFGNMTGRSGSYYNYTFSPASSDTSTYLNNRRTGWNYNAEGQVILATANSTEGQRTMTYNAAGNMISSVQTNQFNTVTYSASYDGDGEVSFESSVTSPGTSESSYIVRSTVLGGDVLTRLDQSGNKKITHVPAEGLLFATQRSSGAPGPFVLTTLRNPLGITETTKAVYDPLGNYIPFQASPDPRPPIGSYNSGSMSGLSAGQANPGGYAVGCVLDSIPTDCNRVIRLLDRLPIKDFSIDGIVTAPWWLLLKAGVTRKETYKKGERIKVEYVVAPGMQGGFEQNPQETITEKPFSDKDLDAMRAIIVAIATPRCQDFINKLLYLAGYWGDDPPVTTNIVDLFDKVREQGGFVSQSLATNNGPSRGFSSVEGAIGARGGAKVKLSSTSDLYTPRTRLLYHAYNAFAEATHVAGHKPSGYVQGAFSDYNLAKAAFALTQVLGTGIENLKLSLPEVDPNNDPQGRWSDKYHDIVKYYCKRTER